MWIEGNRYRKKKYGSANFIPTHRYGIYSKEIHAIRNPHELPTEFLYEPTILKKTDLSDIMHNISAINLDDKEEAFKTRVSIHDQNYEKVILKCKFRPIVVLINLFFLRFFFRRKKWNLHLLQ